MKTTGSRPLPSFLDLGLQENLYTHEYWKLGQIVEIAIRTQRTIEPNLFPCLNQGNSPLTTNYPPIVRKGSYLPSGKRVCVLEEHDYYNLARDRMASSNPDRLLKWKELDGIDCIQRDSWRTFVRSESIPFPEILLDWDAGVSEREIAKSTVRTNKQAQMQRIAETVLTKLTDQVPSRSPWDVQFDDVRNDPDLESHYKSVKERYIKKKGDSVETERLAKRWFDDNVLRPVFNGSRGNKRPSRPAKAASTEVLS